MHFLTRNPSRQLPRQLLVFLVAALFIVTLGLPVGASRPCLAAESGTVEHQAVPQGPLNFDACVRLALQQSPYLTKSSVEIDIRRLDENDSRYSMFPPPVTFRTYYYLNHPKQFGLNPRPYTLNFAMDPYNPFGSYFSLQAQKLATQIAVLAHMKNISEGLERLGKMFLNLGAMKRLAVLQNDLIKLCRENLIYAQNRQNIGTGTSLDLQVANQEMEVAKNERDRLEISQRRVITSLKNFLGFKPEAPVEFEVQNARRQVLGSFDPAAATLEQAEDRSYELKALELKKEMQKYNVALAKARIFPNILFTTQTPDPLSLTDARGLYVAFGLEVPVWDGFKRIRNVSRQKAILKQFGSDKNLKALDLTDKWYNLQEDWKGSEAGKKIAQSQEELMRLKERQAEIRYQSGTEILPTWLEARKASLEAQKTLVNKSLEFDEFSLNLRQLSGDLGGSYVDQKSWQK